MEIHVPELSGYWNYGTITGKMEKPNVINVDYVPQVSTQNAFDFLATLSEEEERPFLTSSGNFLPDSPVKDQPLRPRPDLPQDSGE